MFFILSKILSFLFQPLAWIFFFLVGSLFIKNQRLKKRIIISAIVLLYCLSNPLLYNWAAKAWNEDAVELKEKHEAAVVLLGFTSLVQEPKDRVHVNQSVNRVTQIVPLYRDGLIGKFVLTGGNPSLIENEKSEAEETKKLLLSWGIPEEDIVIEGQSRNTYENLKHAKEHLKQYNSVLLVTSSYHLKRAKACAEKLGIKVTPYATDFRISPVESITQAIIPSMEALNGFHYLVHEWIGYIAYKLRGYC